MSVCKKIMVHSYKGGCGKTVTALGLTLHYAVVRKERVLLIEMDNRGPQFTDIFDVSPRVYLNQFYSNASLRDMIIKVDDLRGVETDNVDIICAEQEPFTVLPGKKRKDYFISVADRLRRQLWSLEQEYNHIIMDTPPGVDYPVINNIAVCDCVVLLTRLDNTVKRTKIVYRMLSDFDKDTVLVANMVPVDIDNLTEEEMGWKVIKRIEDWKSFAKGKKIITIPQKMEIAIELFKNTVPDLEGSFMSYIGELATLIEKAKSAW